MCFFVKASSLTSMSCHFTFDTVRESRIDDAKKKKKKKKKNGYKFIPHCVNLRSNSPTAKNSRHFHIHSTERIRFLASVFYEILLSIDSARFLTVCYTPSPCSERTRNAIKSGGGGVETVEHRLEPSNQEWSDDRSWAREIYRKTRGVIRSLERNRQWKVSYFYFDTFYR